VCDLDPEGGFSWLALVLLVAFSALTLLVR